MLDSRVNELANEAMQSIETEDGEDYAFARCAIEFIIKKALKEDRKERSPLLEGVVRAARIESRRHDQEGEDGPKCELCCALQALDGDGE
jgi:hypothetical protein